MTAVSRPVVTSSRSTSTGRPQLQVVAPSSPPPLREAADAWLDDLVPRLQPRTVRLYGAIVRRAILAWDVPAGAQVTPAVLRAWETGQGRLQPSTRRLEGIVVRAFLVWLAAQGWGPAVGGTIRLPPARLGVPRAVPPGQVAALLGACPPRTAVGRRDRALVCLLAATGLRISEGCALNRADLRGPGPIVVTGKGLRERAVVIPDAVWTPLTAHWADRTDAHPAALVSVEPGHPATRLTPTAARHRLALACHRADLPPITPHQLRHTFATELLGATGDLRLVQIALGHRSVSTTERYTAVSPARLAEGAELTVGRLFGPQAGQPSPPPRSETVPGLVYDPLRHCRRCGGTARTIWRDPALERTCERCGFIWGEAPLG